MRVLRPVTCDVLPLPDRHQEEVVEDQEGMARSLEQSEHPMMVDPVRTDHEEGDRVRRVRGPLLEEGSCEVCAGGRLVHDRNGDLERQERRSDREDAVDKRRQPIEGKVALLDCLSLDIPHRTLLS